MERPGTRVSQPATPDCQVSPGGKDESSYVVNYIDSNICHGISLKKPSGNVGTRTCVAGIRSQQKCYALDHHTSPKKDASSQELSNTVFSHSSNVNSHIITDAIFVM